MKKKLTLILAIWLFSVATVVAQKTRLRAANFTTRDGLASNVVNCGVQDRQGYIWFGTNHGLSRFDGHRFVNFYVEADGGRLIEGITHMVEDTTKNLLLMSGRDYRLLCFDLTRMQFVSADGMEFPEKLSAEKDEELHAARARELGIDRGNRTNRRHDLHYARMDDGHEIFATIDNGFFLYEPKSHQLSHYLSSDEQPIIESDYINGVLQDQSGGVWLLTTFAGVYRLDMRKEALRQHTSEPNIRAFAQLDGNHIAIADMDGHVFVCDLDAGDSKMVFSKGLRAYAINTDDKGRLWIGTRGGGIWMVEDGKMNQLQSLPARQIYDILFAPDGTVWIATLDGGVVEGHERPDGTFSFSQHVPGEKVHELSLDRKGRLWIATESGVMRKSGQVTDTIYNNCKVVCICHAPDGTVWAGSNGYGLLKIEESAAGSTIQFIQVDQGLANNCVESVACDGEGNVIAGTDQGISIIHGADGSIHNVFSSQGLRANTYNENSILITDNGRVFLGSLTGMVELSNVPSGVQEANSIRYRPKLTCIEVNDEPHYGLLAERMELSHEQNNLCFMFSSFIYDDLSSVVYSYWLEGIDRGWRPSTRESQALYTNLSPGRYRLHVRSRLAGMAWSDEQVCEVTIDQPWWWTWWARVFYLALIALIVWYEWHQYQQRISLRRQLDQRLTALYAVEVQQEVSAETDTQKDEIAESGTVSEEMETAEESAKQRVTSQRNKEFLDKLDHLILQNLLQTDFDVNFIAQEMCVSYSTLHRRIKSLTGISANEYVRKHRLAKAMQLLRDGIPASDVSMQCGFSSPSYFTRCFKAEYGMLPSEV